MNKWFYADVSTNGTFLKMNQNEKISLQGSQVFLLG